MTDVDAVVALLRRLGETSPDDATIHNVDCGIHSGFPPCCIAFFVKIWKPFQLATLPTTNCCASLEDHLEHATPQEMFALHSIETYLHFSDSSSAVKRSINYVRCPRCVLEGVVVEPRSCGTHLCDRQRDDVRDALRQQ